MHHGPDHKSLCAANSLCHKHALEQRIKQLETHNNQEYWARKMAERIAQGNYEAYSREKGQFEQISRDLVQLADVVRQVLDDRSEERGRVREYALEQKAKQFEGECKRLERNCEQLAQENAQIRQALSQGRNEMGVREEHTKRKRI